ncbi:Sas10 C-terminal domain-containing protein [Lentinula lateritia]|nr:Sas10 C-terminal domain-containing protein [Lentinula lateritia]
MPRRPSKKSKSAGKPRSTHRADARINKWNDRSDIPMDEEDQFHASRDQILLNEEEEDAGGIDDDEVFALQMEDEESEEDEDEDEESEATEENDNQSSRASPKVTKSKQKATAKGKGKGKESQIESSDDDDEEEEETWGSGKAAYYSSNAAQMESDDEEALQLEEQEARRLQAKARDDMNDEDFGLEDSIEANVTGGSDYLDEASVTVQPVLQDKPSILRHLQKTDPECLALAGDWTDSATTLMKTKLKLEKLEAEGGSKNSFSLGMMHLHYQTLLTYTTTLAFYLYLRASQKYAQKPELLRSHPVMQRLLKLKQSLITLEDLNFAVSDDDDLGDEEEEEEDDIMQDARQLWDREHSNEDEDEDVDSDELDQLLADARSITNSNSNRIVIQPKAPALTHPPKKKRKTASESEKSSLSMFDLVEPEFVSSKPTSSTSPYAAADAFGEATSLQHADAADKSARRKTLRFHTSRIESANARRSNARSNALGGDDDIPYRERKKEKEDRLAREATARVRHQGGADLDDTEPEPRRPDDSDGDGDEEMEDANGYYDLVKKQVKEKKERKKAEYEASRADRFVEEASNGPRSLTRAILANKGLTPHRPKSVRNPRVKKKINFAKAQRKVASQKAVYKGGVSATGGRYEGEKSGISKVVKSVRLG